MGSMTSLTIKTLDGYQKQFCILSEIFINQQKCNCSTLNMAYGIFSRIHSACVRPFRSIGKYVHGAIICFGVTLPCKGK